MMAMPARNAAVIIQPARSHGTSELPRGATAVEPSRRPDNSGEMAADIPRGWRSPAPETPGGYHR